MTGLPHLLSQAHSGHAMVASSVDLPAALLDVLHHGEVMKGHAYQDASDRPDYVGLATL